MTIRKNLLHLTPQELDEFVSARRHARENSTYKALKREPAQQTVARIARDLGIDKFELAAKLEKELEKKG